MSPLRHRTGFSLPGWKGPMSMYVAAVFQTDEQTNSEPKIKKLEPVLLPGKRSRPPAGTRVCWQPRRAPPAGQPPALLCALTLCLGGTPKHAGVRECPGAKRRHHRAVTHW